MRNKLLLILFIFLGYVYTQAQDLDWNNPNLKTKEFIVSETNLILDSLIVIPETITIKNSKQQLLPKTLYSFTSHNNLLQLDKSLLNEQLEISYYIYPESKEKIVFSKDTSLIINIQRQAPKLYEITSEPKKKNDFFEGLTTSGSLVRGITFGNNQSASVQSTLDLELAGQLSKDIQIKAAISDHNIPIEADGYTQRLDEFDKIYIELSSKNSFLRAGHLDLIQNEDYFANFSKKITGIQIGTHLQHQNSFTDLYATGSISRGEFNRMLFNGIEGNQGPYKLRGKQGELYVIVISGSEKVYINGELLTRGEDKDYTINYNTGELTFTPQIYISANSRIVVEYIYDTSNYNRFLFYVGGKHESEKLSVNFNIFSETDNKGSNQDLTDEQKETLSLAGNNPDLMFANNAVITSYDANKILYRKITDNNKIIYEYSTDAEETLYSLTFTYIGENQGNYKIIQLPVNGRVYEYIPPINEIKQGNYEPVTQLIPPGKLQVISTNAEYRFTKNEKVGINLALSNHDPNTFSSIDNKKNMGYAGRLYANKNIDTKNWKSKLYLEYSFIQEDFHILERVNSIEFSRDFNISQEFNGRDQNKIKFDWSNQINNIWTLNYTLNYLTEKDFYNGYKNDLFFQYKTNKTQLFTRLSYLHTNEEISSKSDFIKYNAEFSQSLKKNRIGIGVIGESNKIKDKPTNSYTSSSLDWKESYVFFRTDSAKLNTQFKLYARSDDSIHLGNLKRFTDSYGAVLTSQIIRTEKHNLGIEAHYKKLKYNQEVYSSLKDEDYALGAIRWNKLFLNNGLSLNTIYELSSGQEAQREFKYIKVIDGNGIYKWTDYNNNGIEELDEFEIAEFSDLAQYIRVYTDNINYQKSNKNKLNFTLQLTPSRFMKSPWWDRLTMQSVYLSQSSYLKKDNIAEFNPFSNNNLITQTKSFTTSLNFNRLNIHKWMGIFQFIQNNNTQYIYIGRETRDNTNYQAQLTYKPFDAWIFNLQNNFIKDKSSSELFDTKRFLLETIVLYPTITYEFKKNISLSAFFKYQNKRNKWGIEELDWKEAGLEFRWSDDKRTSLNGTLSYIENKLKGNNYSVVSNQMMEGLQQGKNMIWKIYIQRELSTIFTLNLIYEGRENKDTSTIHTGSMQIRASF